jgi:hypothetical protein
MDRPPLPEIDPYVNRNLFSDHFLKELLPQDESWQVDQDRLKLAMQGATNLYAGRDEEWAGRNEPQLEDKLVRPMLQALGHKFEVQPSLPTPETVRRPDYAFFGTDEERLKAKRDHDGQAEYFNKAIAVGDAKRWDRSLDKKERSGRDSFDMLSPSWQIDYYLRMSGVKWGILTNGRLWRLYNQNTSFRLDICYEIDVPRLLAAKDLETFKYFYLFFRRQAFVPDAEGLCFLDRVYQGSLEYAQAVGDDLKENVYKALRLLAEGFLHTQGNDLDPVHDLDDIHANSLVLLYRLLFINYAEDRGLLPRDNALYKESYGLVSMEREIASKLQRGDSLSPLHTTYWGKLKTLFDLINRGTERLGVEAETMDVPPYNGGLFDPKKHPFLEQHQVADKWVSQVVDLLARSQGEGLGRGFVDYSSLDVRHLGSIYEGLLEYKPRVADEGMVAVKRGGKEQWIRSSEAGGARVLERVEPGSVYLATDRGERKATGSYYTPDYIVKYIAEHTVGPLIEQKMKEDDPTEGILSLKVLDPAMGSGHFLVEATDRLAHALVAALGGSDEQREEEDVRWARREVVERCIYGVDLNPLAVELAKLSLWLHTVAEGKPLNFLDHHLKVGDSLIGAWVDDLGSLPVRRKRGAAKQAEPAVRQMNLFETRLDERLPVMLNKVLEIIRRRSDTLEDIKAKAAADQAVEELKTPFKAVADLWVSTCFGNEVTQGEYQEALEHIAEPARLFSLPAVEAVRKTADDRRFFHWELEFPEVFYEDSQRRQNPGFDAVAGNPPYFLLQGTDLQKPLSVLYPEVFSGSNDVSHFFLTCGTRLLRTEGLLGFIVTRYWIEAHLTSGLREYLTTSAQPTRIVDFGSLQVWPDVNVLTIVCVFSKSSAVGATEIYVADERRFSTAVDFFTRAVVNAESKPFLTPTTHFGSDPWYLRALETGPLWERVWSQAATLDDLTENTQGIKTGNNAAFTVTAETISNYGLEEDVLVPVAQAQNVGRYDVQVDEYVIYTDGGTDIDATPAVKSFLSRFEKELSNRAECNRGLYAWWRLQRPRDRNIMLRGQRILVPLYATENRFFFSKEPIVGMTDVYIITATDRRYEGAFLSAVLNSRLLTLYHRVFCKVKRAGYLEYSGNTISRLPIRRISFVTEGDERRHLALQAQALYTADDELGLLTFTDAALAEEPEQSDVVHDALAFLAQQMLDMSKEKQAEANGFLGWLQEYTGLPVQEWRLKTVVVAYWEHPWDDLKRALRENRKAIQKASGRNVEGREALEDIEREFEKSIAKLNPLLERIARTDRLIDLIVYRLYGLTEEEVAIVEESVGKQGTE